MPLAGLATAEIINLSLTLASQAIRAAELAQAGDKEEAIKQLDSIRERYGSARVAWDAAPGPSTSEG